ncbi:MAG: alkane 1-monooxygenase [Pseudomonadota bacterium]
MIFVAQTKAGDTITYRDTKRYLWLLSLTVPLVPSLAVWLYFASGNQPIVTILPLVYSFILIPILDLVFGEDPANPPAEIVEKMAEDSYYRWLLHASVPLFWIALLSTAWLIGTQDLPWWAVIAMAISTGFSSGTAITVGHELGHKTNRLDRFSAMLANAVSGYGHFCIEHNKGHHTWVATPEDPASARLNESVYGFAAREIPGTLKRGWQHERDRLSRKGLPFLHWRNEILHGYAITATVNVALIITFGWIMIPFLLIHNFIGWYALTEANYVEHYGLKRQKRENGRYEPCQPHHSWNTNHVVSNLMLFHLQRHSDHHANPMRPYQSLRNFEDLPRLPSGYPGCFALAAIPPLWFKVMNPKVMAWADGDISRVNTG